VQTDESEPAIDQIDGQQHCQTRQHRDSTAAP
jgi:hypothetical protein